MVGDVLNALKQSYCGGFSHVMIALAVPALHHLKDGWKPLGLARPKLFYEMSGKVTERKVEWRIPRPLFPLSAELGPV
jgi:hypothetical protein